jgi:uncharacterized protein with PIN domain
MPEFFEHEKCERCGGPIERTPHHKTTFVEEDMDYVVQTVWPCYMCGHENFLDSTPRYVL